MPPKRVAGVALLLRCTLAAHTDDGGSASQLSCSEGLFTFFRCVYGEGALRVLDVGGGDGAVGLSMRTQLPQTRLDWSCIDVRPAGANCTKFDGERLDGYASGRADVVLFNWVLHHASAKTLELLREAARVARSYILIDEDLKAEDSTQASRQYRHDWRATFRAAREWRELFQAARLRLVAEHVPHRLCDKIYRTPRRLFVLTPLSTRSSPRSEAALEAMLSEADARNDTRGDVAHSGTWR